MNARRGVFRTSLSLWFGAILLSSYWELEKPWNSTYVPGTSRYVFSEKEWKRVYPHRVAPFGERFKCEAGPSVWENGTRPFACVESQSYRLGRTSLRILTLDWWSQAVPLWMLWTVAVWVPYHLLFWVAQGFRSNRSE